MIISILDTASDNWPSSFDWEIFEKDRGPALPMYRSVLINQKKTLFVGRTVDGLYRVLRTRQ